MSEGAPTATATERTLLVPAILPNSLRVVLNIFEMDIGRRQAKSRIRGTNRPLIDERCKHGGVHTQEKATASIPMTQPQNADTEARPSND